MQKISLNGSWNLRTDNEQNGLAENWASKPLTPEYTLEIPGAIQQLDELAERFPAKDNLRNSFKNIYFLEKEFDLPELKAGERCHLCFNGISPACHIWVNGLYVAKNIYGLNKIDLDITNHAMAGKNRVTVAITTQFDGLVTGMYFCGVFWSGIYSEAYVEIGGSVRVNDAYISTKGGKSVAKATLVNSHTEDLKTTLQVVAGDITAEKTVTLKAGSSNNVDIELNLSSLPRWSYRDPNLIDVAFSVKDGFGNTTINKFKTGLREITTTTDRILVDGVPTFFKGTGSEYASPTIAPLTDEKIIRSRFKALLDHGFNFYRYHTHVPTEEEMVIADEMGIMLDVEFGLISNFNKTLPIDEGFQMFEKFIRQTRQHPSVFVYCLGNEGSQLMVDSYIERNKAKKGYKMIKDNTENQLGIIAFGLQGELPELENDFETPHLWSEDFRISYDGLTDIPWDYLGRTTNNKPALVHEYGKFGVWPSRKEEKDTTFKGSVLCPNATQSYEWLVENGIGDFEQRLIENSRKSASSSNRIILEDARRQPYVSGYALWTFYRRTKNNAGLADDIGTNYNGDPNLFKDGVNADVALLMDRGFQNRAFPCEVPQNIKITLSNFSTTDLSGILKLTLSNEDNVIAEKMVDASAAVGVTHEVCEFNFSVPVSVGDAKLELKAEFIADGKIVSKNAWELWSFDTTADTETKLFLHIDDIDTFRALKKVFPAAQRLASVDSIIIGCRSWRNPQLADTASKNKEITIVADVFDDVIKECIANGCKVMLLDSGKLPEDWMLPPICPELGERDTGRFFTSFRAGWDKGNLVTIINDDGTLNKYPNEGFCDLQFYDLIQSSRILRPEKINEVFGKKCDLIIESISKVPVVAKSESIVQDPNAIKEQTSTIQKLFNARRQGYLMKVSNKVSICTLKLADNPSGIGMLKQMLSEK